MPLLRDDLLTPIAGDNPSGVSLRYDPIYDRIKEARREDAELPSGEFPDGPRKTADPQSVLRMATEALATQTKDLQLAAWTTEALLKREGFSGLAEGLTLCRDLLDQFWDTLHPEIEDDDLEMRATPLEWLATQLLLACRQVPLNRDGHGFLQYEEALSIGYESAVSGNRERQEHRENKIRDGKIPPEDFDRAVDGTPPEFYIALLESSQSASAALDALDALANERLGYDAPNFSPLREVLGQVGTVVKVLHSKRVPKPDVPDVVEGEGGEGGEGDPSADGAEGAGPSAGARGHSGSGEWLAREPGGPTVLQRAEAELRAGRPKRAVELLMREAGRTRSRRGRFIRRTQAARILVDASLHGVAVPLLEELMSEIEDRRLEEWEPGELVAEPLALLWRCLRELDRDDDTREQLYLRVCRLDPVQALVLEGR